MQVEGPLQGMGHTLRFQLTYSNTAYTDADRVNLSSYTAMVSWLYLGCTFNFGCADAILHSFSVSKNYFPQWVTSWSFGKANHSPQSSVNRIFRVSRTIQIFNLFLLLNYQETPLTLKFELITFLLWGWVHCIQSQLFSWLKTELHSEPMQNSFFIFEK